MNKISIAAAVAVILLCLRMCGQVTDVNDPTVNKESTATTAPTTESTPSSETPTIDENEGDLDIGG